MRVLIVGAGVVGSNLAEELSDSGHDVSVIDADSHLVSRLKERMDVLTIEGNGAQPSVLRRAGIADAEMVIAVTNVDEVNLVICMVANKLGVKHKIARLRNDEYTSKDAVLTPSEVGIDTVINPESIITETLARILEIPGSTDVSAFAEGQVLAVTFDICAGAPIAGKKLLELGQMVDTRTFLIAAIFRGEVPMVPRGDDRIEVGDHVVVLAKADAMDQVLPLVQPVVKPVERIVIYGASLVGRQLAKTLQDRLARVVLIEPDKDLARRAAEELKKTLVLHGEASDPDVLSEADTDHCCFFLALSRDDEANLLAALMARRAHARRVAVLTQEPRYVPILSNIGMDVVLNPRLVTVGEILRYIRKGEIHMVTRFKESEAEVMELEAMKGSKVTKKPLKEIEFPNGSIIGAVMRESQMVIPDGNCQIGDGETVLVFALPEAIAKIEKLFSKRKLL